MPLHLYSPPVNCYEMVSQNLESLTSLVQTKQNNPLKMSKPLPIYDVHFSDELKKGVVMPKLTGCRCFVVQNDEAISMADIAMNEKGENPSFLYFTKGDIVKKIISKMSELESLDALKKDDFEIRLLRINSVNLMSIWLHGSNQDFIYPIGTQWSNKASPYTFGKLSEWITKELNTMNAVGALTPPQ